jgi:hypothetical protein
MRALQKTLFIIALIILLTQTVRHLYVRWVEPTRSILDKYQPSVKDDIKNANSLEELVKQYEEARKIEPDPESQRVDPTNHSRKISETESSLWNAVGEWEKRTKEIFELRFFWCSGLVLLLLGLLCYLQRYPWLGLTIITAGIAEMIWWTSPLFRWGGESREFDKLLTNKNSLLLSVNHPLIDHRLSG